MKMPDFKLLLSTYWLYLVIAAIGVAVFLGLRYHWIGAGEDKANLRTITRQATHSQHIRKNNARIDKETPFNSDKHTAINWLSQYTTTR